MRLDDILDLQTQPQGEDTIDDAWDQGSGTMELTVHLGVLTYEAAQSVGFAIMKADADPNTAILVYAGFLPGAAAYYFIGRTSEGSPQWAGIIADANQLAGHPLGFLNLKLYLLSSLVGQSQFFHDITIGNNSFNGVPGYGTTTGWDLASGWGTPNLGKLVGELAKQ